MSLQVWLPLTDSPINMIPGLASFSKEGSITVTADSDGWYKVQDSSHTSSRWGAYYDFKVKSNTTYTLKVYSKSTTGITADIGIQSFSGSPGWSTQRDTNNTSTEKYTEYTWTTGATDYIARIYLAMRPSTTVANNYVFYKQPEVWETPKVKNQGITRTDITNDGISSFFANGKLGNTIRTAINAPIDINYSGSQINTGSISFGGWFKFNQSEIATQLANSTITETRKAPTGNLIGNNSYGGIGLHWVTNDMYTDGVFNEIKTYVYIRSTTAGSKSGGEIQISFDTWTHIFLVFDKNNNTLKLYINGILQNTLSNIPSFSDARSDNIKINNALVGGGNGPSAYIPFYCNDIRLYDNALSEQEVKKLSQGLVLHYTLSNSYIESTINLITKEDCLSDTCYNASISKYNYGSTSDIYKTVTTYEGRKGTKVYMGTNGNTCFPYIYISNMYTSDGTNSPAYKTLSFDYYGTIGNYLGPYPLGSGSGTASYKVICNEIVTTGEYAGYGYFPVTPNEWNHIEITFHGTTSADAQWGYIRIGNSGHTSDTSNFWFFANMQLETKDHSTGYAGPNGVRNNSIIYDASGFCNNGNISGTITISNDTPKYNYSIQMPSAATISHNRCIDNNTNQEWTCCAWVKLSTTDTSNIQLNNFNQGNRIVHSANGAPLLYLNSGLNDYYNYGNLNVSSYEWTHIAFVFKNSNATKLIYINGEEHTNKNGPNKTSTPLGIPDTVYIGNNFSGHMSDYREYATALSPSDILELYKLGHNN